MIWWCSRMCVYLLSWVRPNRVTASTRCHVSWTSHVASNGWSVDQNLENGTGHNLYLHLYGLFLIWKTLCFHALTNLVSPEYFVVEISRWRSDTPYLGREIDLSQRPLPDNTSKTHKRQTSIPQAGFEPAIPVSDGPQTHALYRAATGLGYLKNLRSQSFIKYDLFHSCCIRCGPDEERILDVPREDGARNSG